MPLAIGFALQNSGIDTTMKSLYSVISGPAGQKRDWTAFRGLFADQAQMRVVLKRQGKSRLVLITPDDYVAKSGPYLEKNGFFEKEVKRKAMVYGDMATVWSTYESRNKPEDEKPFERGINTLTLAQVDGVWKIISIAWTGESDAGPIPAEFLPGG